MSEFLESLSADLDTPFVASTVRVLFVVLLTALAVRLTSRIGSKVNKGIARHTDLLSKEGVKRAQTMGNIVRYSLNSLIITVAAITVLHETGIDIKPLLAGAGVAGIVIGLGAQNLMRDSLAGFFVLVEHQYDVGDVVAVAGVSGTVERVTLRMTQLRDADGIVHFVPNGQASVVANLTRDWTRAQLDVDVAYKEDIDRVIEVLKSIGREMESDSKWRPLLLEPMEVLGVQQLGESSVQIRVFFKTQPSQRWSVVRELRRRVKNRFDVEGIEIPFPQYVVSLSTDQQESAGPDADK